MKKEPVASGVKLQQQKSEVIGVTQEMEDVNLRPRFSEITEQSPLINPPNIRDSLSSLTEVKSPLPKVE